jgi:hypothetical protein
MEPSVDELEAHAQWSSKFRDKLKPQKVESFPTRYQILDELYQEKQKKQLKDSATRLRTSSSKGSRSKDMNNVAVQKPEPRMGYSTQQREILKPNLAPWLGPGAYDNIDPPSLRTDKFDVSYQSSFKSGRSKLDENDCQGLRTKVKRRYEALRSQYLLSKANKDQNQDYLLSLKDLDEESSAMLLPSQNKVDRSGSRKVSRGNTPSQLSRASDPHALLLSRQISERSILSKATSDISNDFSTPRKTPTESKRSSGHSFNIGSLNLNATLNTNYTSTNQSRRSSMLPSSRRVSVSDTSEFAAKLLDHNQTKYNPIRKDYTFGGLDGHVHGGILASSDGLDEKDELEALALTLLQDSLFAEMNKPNNINRIPSSASGHQVAGSTMRRGSITKSQSICSVSTCESIAAAILNQRSSSEQDAHPSSPQKKSLEKVGKGNNKPISSTYPPVTVEIGPLVRKWYQDKDIYRPNKPQVTKYVQAVPPSSAIDLFGLLLPGDGRRAEMERVDEEPADLTLEDNDEENDADEQLREYLEARSPNHETDLPDDLIDMLTN